MIANKKSNYIIVPIVLSLVLIGISLIPLPELPQIRFVATDKLGHLIAFMLLALAYLWSFRKHKEWMFDTKKALILTFFICAGIGAFIELLQHFLPINRFGDWFDFYFDIAGIGIAFIIYQFMKNATFIFGSLFILFFSPLQAQEELDSRSFQQQLNKEFADPEESPLDSIDLVTFKELDFFPIDESFIVEAKLVKQTSPTFFGMETTTDRRPEYRIYAYAFFTLEGKECKLTIYQNKKLMNSLEYGNYLFLPFTDLTNGKTSYYGGRYVDLKIQEGEVIEIDFNKSYNPYCAYSKRYSCPIVPDENHLDLAVEAGVKKFH